MRHLRATREWRVGRPPRNTRFPAYRQLLTPAAKSLIEQVYHVDFTACRESL